LAGEVSTSSSRFCFKTCDDAQLDVSKNLLFNVSIALSKIKKQQTVSKMLTLLEGLSVRYRLEA